MLGSLINSGLIWTFYMNWITTGLNFVFNNLVITQVGPDAYGIAAVKLNLILTTLLTFVREGVRLASIKEGSIDDIISKKRVIIIGWYPSYLLCIITIPVLLFQYNNINININENIALLMYCIAAIIETIAEPWFNAFAHSGNPIPGLQATAGAASFQKLGIFIGFYFQLNSLLCFGIGQIVYSIAFTIALMMQTSQLIESTNEAIQYSDFHPHHFFNSISIDKDFYIMQWTAIQSTTTAVLKHILTESDKALLSFTVSSKDIGVFAVAHNYGSLVARTVFAPIEQNARLVFARTATSIKTKKEVDTLASVLSGIIRIVLILGLGAAIFGPTLTRPLIYVLLNRKSTWNDNDRISVSTTLDMYCPYLLVLALNGVSEGFLHTAALPSQIFRINCGLIISSGVFISSIWIANQWYNLKIGPIEVVIANATGMLIRVLWNFFHIRDCFQDPKISFSEKYKSSDVNDNDSNMKSSDIAFNWFDIFYDPILVSVWIATAAVMYNIPPTVSLYYFGILCCGGTTALFSLYYSQSKKLINIYKLITKLK